jgi:hypothetical protein
VLADTPGTFEGISKHATRQELFPRTPFQDNDPPGEPLKAYFPSGRSARNLISAFPGTLVAGIVDRAELLSEGERIARTGNPEVEVK